MNPKVLKSAEILWNFHNTKEELVKSDLIMVLGSHDIRVAERGVDLFLQEYADTILFSGGLGNLTLGKWTTLKPMCLRKLQLVEVYQKTVF